MITIDDSPFNAYSIGLGNKLFIYMFNRLLAERTGYALNVPMTINKCHSGPRTPLQFECLPGTVLEQRWGVDDGVMRHKTIEQYAIELLEENTGVNSTGYFLRYDLYKPYVKRMREIYAPLYSNLTIRPKNEVAIMLRNSHIDPTFTLPISYYTSILDNMSFEKLYFSCEDPNRHIDLLKALEKYNPIFIEGDSMERLVILAGFQTLVLCQGTFGFWGGFMSEASTVYCPITTRGPNMTTDPLVNLIVDDDPRYVNIHVDTNFEIMKDYK